MKKSSFLKVSYFESKLSTQEFFQKTNEWIRFLLLCDVFLFVFWKKLKTPKKTFRNYLTFKSVKKWKMRIWPFFMAYFSILVKNVNGLNVETWNPNLKWTLSHKSQQRKKAEDTVGNLGSIGSNTIAPNQGRRNQGAGWGHKCPPHRFCIKKNKTCY